MSTETNEMDTEEESSPDTSYDSTMDTASKYIEKYKGY